MKLCCLEDYEAEANRRLLPTAAGYYASGACAEQTLHNNKTAFQRLRLRPRVLRDVAKRDHSVVVLGRRIPFPIGVAPAAMQKMAHPDGECANAKATENFGTVYTLSTLSTCSLEEVAEAAPKVMKWFQLYIFKDRALSEKVVKRAAAAGFSAIVLTVDASTWGKRRNDERNKFTLPPHLRLANFTGELANKISTQSEGSALANYVNTLFDLNITWEDVKWLKRISGLPVIVKGILTAEDAIIAADLGVEGIIVSNHGGRQLDSSPASIEALPEIAKAVGDRTEVYLDGGVRTGTDVFKAVALGARMVLVGRPALWGLACGGEEGVKNVLNILGSEFDIAMALTGCKKISDINSNRIVALLFYIFVIRLVVRITQVLPIMEYQLTEGAIQTIMSGGEVVSPILQILGSKEISGQKPNTRYRILISDGVFLNSYAMLASHLTPMLTTGQLTENSIIKVTNHVASIVKNPDKGDKRIMVILDLEVLKHGSEVGMKIGNPVMYDSAAAQQLPNPTAGPRPTPMETLPSKNFTRPDPPALNRTVSNMSSSNETVYNSPKTTKTHPIASISPYQNNWTIKARVTAKTPIKTWSNPKGEGKLFSVDLVDESGEIRATAFRDQVDKFFTLLEEDKLFFISKCQVKMANKKFSSLNNNYELTFTNDTRIIPCTDEDSSIPKLQFNFTPLSTIQDVESGTLLDFIGVCKSSGDVVSITSRTTNKELKKKEVTLVDRSLAAVTLTLWGTQAEEFNGDSKPVIAVKGGRVSEFGGGKSVSLINSSVFQVNPDIPEAHKLKGWYDELSEDCKFNSVSARTETGGGKVYLLSEALAAKLGCGDKAEYFSVYATVMHVRQEKCVYKACPTPDCQKKVIDQNTGQYRCEKCNREFDSFKYRLMLSVNIGDFTDHQWITIFQEAAEELLGVKADDVGRWQDTNDSKFSEVFKNINLHPFMFRLRAKMETFNDESRLKLTAFTVKKPDYKDRCRKLISEIKELTGLQTAAN